MVTRPQLDSNDELVSNVVLVSKMLRLKYSGTCSKLSGGMSRQTSPKQLTLDATSLQLAVLVG